ncbi:MAG: biotin-dependent carboxyltransferase family protein [Saprospiraceae bacterium]|nr:biotin-dependent carboxyltransferase family protein [Saprospiraceae bacterium]
MGSCRVISPGVYTSIQDEGRTGVGHLGIPISGALDKNSMYRANLAIGNPSYAAVLEITLNGPTLEFDQKTKLAIEGAEIEIWIDEDMVPNNKPIEIKAGSRLKFGKVLSGVRCYLAIQGGFQGKKIMGSMSMCRFVTEAIRLQKGDLISFGALEKVETKSMIPDKTILEERRIDVLPGPEFDWLSEEDQKSIYAKEFHLKPQSNRSAFLFEGDPLEIDKKRELITSPVFPGIVQCYPNGQLVLLHRDAQRTGGYPRLLIFPEESLDVIAQKRIREKFTLNFENR